jgi:hypothetical protein
VNEVPTTISWMYFAQNVLPYMESLAWDMTTDGRILFVESNVAPFSADVNGYKAVRVIGPNGASQSFPALYEGRLELMNGTGILGCPLRSRTQSDFQLVASDLNGGNRVGRMPLDEFYDKPCDPTVPDMGPDSSNPYTGLQLVYNNPRVQSILINRLSGEFYALLHHMVRCDRDPNGGSRFCLVFLKIACELFLTV